MSHRNNPFLIFYAFQAVGQIAVVLQMNRITNNLHSLQYQSNIFFFKIKILIFHKGEPKIKKAVETDSLSNFVTLFPQKQFFRSKPFSVLKNNPSSLNIGSC